MDRDETVALFLQGREAWNAWAEKMLAERKALEASGAWKSSQRFPSEPEKGENPETQAWLDQAGVIFSRCLFLVRGAEGTKETAGEDRESGEGSAPPVKSIQLRADRVDFARFIFPGYANFRSATFTGNAGFRSAAFTGDAGFGSATFTGSADFWGATFSDAGFESATFTRDAGFQSATFTGSAGFRSATFTGSADFRSATFQNSTAFGEAKFLKEADFTGIKVERAFDMTGAAFKQVPAFNQADFKQAPDLDDVTFPPVSYWRGGKAKLAAQYRALRRMAIQGADYEREQMAYKGELRARRWTVDKWWAIGTWIGLFYDAFADCGRSIVRPAIAWCASIVLFAAFYWQQVAAGVEARCTEAGGAAVQALFLSVKNALVIFGGTRDARVNQAYLCLYNGSAEQPHIPPTVTFVETLAQIPVSATLIFLFLLAVKNRFKIK